MFHSLFILKNQACTKIHVLFPRRSKCLLNNFRINHIFPRICIKWWDRRFINRGRICNMLNSNSSTHIIFITFSHIINMRIVSNFMVINTPVKVASLNPLFVLISIVKIFTINGSMINKSSSSSSTTGSVKDSPRCVQNWSSYLLPGLLLIVVDVSQKGGV